jgi:hypothetical protein
VEPVEQERAECDHDQPHHDRAENSPFQNLGLRLRGNREVLEDQNEDEEVVDAE